MENCKAGNKMGKLNLVAEKESKVKVKYIVKKVYKNKSIQV